MLDFTHLTLTLSRGERGPERILSQSQSVGASNSPIPGFRDPCERLLFFGPGDTQVRHCSRSGAVDARRGAVRRGREWVRWVWWNAEAVPGFPGGRPDDGLSAVSPRSLLPLVAPLCGVTHPAALCAAVPALALPTRGVERLQMRHTAERCDEGDSELFVGKGQG